MLLLHQCARSHDEFRELPPLLRGHRAIAMDMPGYGQSAGLAHPQTIERYAAGALALLDALGVQRAAVLGHHTGGVVALELAAAAPERVRGLVWASAPARYVVEERVGAVTAPVLLLGADADPFALPALDPMAAALTAGAGVSRVVTEGGTVALMEQAAPEVAAAVLEFLARSPA